MATATVTATSRRSLTHYAKAALRGGLRRSLVADGAAAGLGCVALLVGAVARADERAGEDGAEAERLALLAEPAELVGMHPAVDRRVLCARLQVLADRHDVD